MKRTQKHFIYFGLLLIVATAVYYKVYFNFDNFVDNFGTNSNSPYTSCSSYTASTCPSKDCMVLTDETRCAGNSKPSGLESGEKNDNVASSAYANNSSTATCDSAGYLKTCATRSLQ